MLIDCWLAMSSDRLPPDTEAEDVDDFEALRLAALEQVPLERRSRTAILPKVKVGPQSLLFIRV